MKEHPLSFQTPVDSESNLQVAAEWRAFIRAHEAHEHRAWIAWANHRDALERAAAAPVAPANGTVGSCYSIIAQAFGSRGLSVSYAYAIAQRESHCSASAWNSKLLPLGHASGLFQILSPGNWYPWASECGWAGASPFNAVANANVAACHVAKYGWGAWAL